MAEGIAQAVPVNVELLGQAIPTLLLFKDGQVIRTFVGVHSEAVLTRTIEAATETPSFALSKEAQDSR